MKPQIRVVFHLVTAHQSLLTPLHLLRAHHEYTLVSWRAAAEHGWHATLRATAFAGARPIANWADKGACRGVETGFREAVFIGYVAAGR